MSKGLTDFVDEARLQILANCKLQTSEELRGRVEQRQVGVGDVISERSRTGEHGAKAESTRNEQQGQDRGQRRRKNERQRILRQEDDGGNAAADDKVNPHPEPLNVAAHEMGDPRMAKP